MIKHTVRTHAERFAVLASFQQSCDGPGTSVLCRKAFRVRQTEKRRLGINDLSRISKKDTYPKEFCNSLISAASLQLWLKFKPLPMLATTHSPELMVLLPTTTKPQT